MDFSAAQVKDRLLANLESVLVHLFPNGKTVGHEFRVGSVDGEAGKSLAVQLRGSARGVWEDFAYPGDKDQCGDIMKLWCRARRQSFKEAFPEMARFVGFTRIERVVVRPKPPRPPTGDILKMSAELRAYWNNRGIADETLKKYRVREHRRTSSWNTLFTCFSFVDPYGEPVMIKSTGINYREDGTKDIWTSQPFYTLWGWWLVGPDTREIGVSEGEADAMSLCQMGFDFPILSLPAGASNMEWIENDFETLQRFERLNLFFDNDPPHPRTGICAGEEAAKLVAKRLGRERCFRVPIPGGFKDANEVLVKAEDERLTLAATWLQAAHRYDPPTLCNAGAYRLETRAKLERRRKGSEFNTFLWPKVPFMFREKECTMFSGYPSGGKSALLYQTHLHEAANGHKVLFASYEIDPEEINLECAHILCGCTPSEADLDRAIDWLDGRIYYYVKPQLKRSEYWPDLLADMAYAVQRFGIDRIVIDSIHFLVAKDDYETQDRIVTEAKEFARDQRVHLAIVCHSKIKQGEAIIPGMSLVEGSGGMCKPIDNGVTVWRNSTKQERIEQAQEKDDADKLAQARALHDGVFSVWKQRETGRMFRQKLWFDPDAKTFRLSPNEQPPALLALVSQGTGHEPSASLF